MLRNSEKLQKKTQREKENQFQQKIKIKLLKKTKKQMEVHYQDQREDNINRKK